MKQIPRKELIKILKANKGIDLINPSVMSTLFDLYGDEWDRNNNGEWVKLTHSTRRDVFLDKKRKK